MLAKTKAKPTLPFLCRFLFHYSTQKTKSKPPRAGKNRIDKPLPKSYNKSDHTKEAFMQLTVLSENTTSRADITAEHGLSLYIEACGRRILFDMGQGALFAENAKALGISLAAVEIAILSHGHYDHGGGLSTFLSENSHAPIYHHADAFLPHYHGSERYIGLDSALAGHPRLIPTRDTATLGKGLTLYTYNALPRRHPIAGADLTRRLGDTLLPDDFCHEQYLEIREGGRRILISGCSHKGILNVMAWARPDIFIGGFHTSALSEDEALRVADALSRYPTRYYTCHCTGCEAYRHMLAALPTLGYLAAGDTLTL